jgi:hypothetical protein
MALWGMELMPARPKLTLEVFRRLCVKLQQRYFLLQELARYDLKRLAAAEGLHLETVRRLEHALQGRCMDHPDVMLISRKLRSTGNTELSTLRVPRPDVLSENAVDSALCSSAHAQSENPAREVGVVEGEQRHSRQDRG